MRVRRILVALAVLPLLATACGDDGGDSAATTTTTTTEAPATTTEAPATTVAPVGEAALDAPGGVSITVDGDDADWAGVDGLDMTLVPITDEDFEAHDATVKVAHDGDSVYVLFSVEDDLNWDVEDKHKSGSIAVQWAIDSGAGVAMGAEDDDRLASSGSVDIWHWELECAAGDTSGGAVSDAGDGSPGNDAGCNFDDEFASDTETRSDDDSASAENSLAGVWTHSAAAQDGDGTWFFEMSRPMQTGDEGDAQFEAGGTSQLALAYWDADSGPDGWSDEYHVVSALDGWIDVNFG